MQNTFISALVAIFFCACSYAQQGNVFSIMFYNTENLFDTIDDPLTDDSEFLSVSKKKWDSEKYYLKLDRLSSVIDFAAGKGNFPDIVGLCEVENRSVLNDLVKNKILAKVGYGIVHEESPDARGIDVALLYRPSTFKYLTHQKIPVTFTDDTTRTRDILYVKGIANKRDTLHIYVNHWPSRRGGAEKSEPKRMAAASALKHHKDSLVKIHLKAKMVMIGDFNDYPINNSMIEVLEAKGDIAEVHGNPLFNTMYNKHVKEKTGTHYYKREWGVLDQIIVSGSLLDSTGSISCSPEGAAIVKEEALFRIDAKSGEKVPFTTYSGDYYSGGYSDHLPVIIGLKIK